MFPVTSSISYCVCLVVALSTVSVSAQTISIEFDEGSNHVFSESERTTIERIANTVATEIVEVLPGMPSSITLTVSTSTFVIPETGEMGMAPEPGRVNWFVDPSRRDGVEEIAKNRLRSTLFHELHHLTRGYVVKGGVTRTSFMDVVVSEGMATTFERDFAEANPPWAEYPNEIETWVEELMLLPLSALAQYSDWMIQHPDGRQWIGYRAGAYIVDRAMEASGMTSAEMVLLSTQEVLELAGIE